MLPAFRLADWRVDPSLHTVTGPSGSVRLEPKVLQVLIYLVEHAGEVVARERLIESVWRGTFVTDDALARAISELRRVFQDDARNPRVIETVPKAGYRLIAPVASGETAAVAFVGTTRQWIQPAAAAQAQGVELAAARVLRPGFPAVPNRLSVPAATATIPVRFWTRRTAVGALLAALVLATASYLTGRWHRAIAEPSVGDYRRVTRAEVLFPPFPSEIPLLTDGPRIYFTEFINGVLRPGHVSSYGGETQALDFGVAQNEIVEAISPDGSELLLAAWNADGTALSDVPYWIVPLVGGAPRRLGGVTAHGASWLPDGRILYAHANELFLVAGDGSGNTRLASVGGRPYWPRVSPDGSRVRFARFTSASTFRIEALWEIRLDGTGLRPLLPQWNNPSAECCGEWAPDGAYYVFQSTRDGLTHLWALRESATAIGGTPDPVQLTRGPVQFRRPVFSRDGRQIFANGWQSRGELTRFDPRSGALTPYMNGLSAEWLTHSRDGQSVVYVTYPEGELWRARADGTRRGRLTPPHVRACCARLSPDAKYVAFVGQSGDAAARTYIIAMDGTGLRDIGPGGEATWAPDGRQLVMAMGDNLAHVPAAGGTPSSIPGSEGLSSPVWSADGRRLAAISSVTRRLNVYEFSTGCWGRLASPSVAFPNWSHDAEQIYFFTGQPAPLVIDDISRWDLKSGRLERLTNVTHLRLAWGIKSHWLGVAPDDSLLFLRELSAHEIYALDWHSRH